MKKRNKSVPHVEKLFKCSNVLRFHVFTDGRKIIMDLLIIVAKPFIFQQIAKKNRREKIT